MPTPEVGLLNSAVSGLAASGQDSAEAALFKRKTLRTFRSQKSSRVVATGL
jgi:hypothetical protein